MPIYMVGIRFQSRVQVVRLDFTNYLLQTPPTPTIFEPDLTFDLEGQTGQVGEVSRTLATA